MSTPRQIYAQFEGSDTRAIITLYDKEAPKTCAAIWGALETPIKVPAAHAMFAGPEIMTGLPKEAQNFDPTLIPNENQTCFPEPGECLWFYQGANAMKGLPDELWEIGIFYAGGGRCHGPLGYIPVNFFAKVTENLEAFAADCSKTHTEGIKTIEYGRV